MLLAMARFVNGYPAWSAADGSLHLHRDYRDDRWHVRTAGLTPDGDNCVAYVRAAKGAPPPAGETEWVARKKSETTHRQAVLKQQLVQICEKLPSNTIVQQHDPTDCPLGTRHDRNWQKYQKNGGTLIFCQRLVPVFQVYGDKSVGCVENVVEEEQGVWCIV